jgi:hypothetical protein
VALWRDDSKVIPDADGPTTYPQYQGQQEHSPNNDHNPQKVYYITHKHQRVVVEDLQEQLPSCISVVL